MSYDKAIGQLRNSVSRPTLYKIQMPSRFVGRDTNDYLEYFCNQAQLPSVRYNSVAVSGIDLMGITRNQPTMPVWTNPMTVSVIENSDFETYKAFKDWFDQTADGIDQQGERNIRLKYYKQIVGDIELTKLEFPNNTSVAGLGAGGGNLKEVLKVRFINSYIMSVGPIQLSSERRDSFVTFPLEFHYESFTTDN